MSVPTLRLRNLSRMAESKQIVNSFSFDFFPGRIYSIIGPSGAGKTSLMRLLNRLDELTSGEITLDNIPTDQLPPTELRKQVGYLFQTPYLFPDTVADNISMAQPSLDLSGIESLLAQSAATGLRPDTSIKNLSTGERQRVALARLLATDPSVIMLDEPTSALDHQATETIERTLINLASERNLCVIIITHSTDQALRLGGETLLMVDGKLAEHGQSIRVIHHPTTTVGRQFRDRELK